ncbi:MAG: ABC transporter permease [Athalassotoga sp.]|uniref:ABC transporter permease n=1 Tax=Athalassotoga sp. TaxID=2022597 RepID=UPI003D06C9AB
MKNRYIFSIMPAAIFTAVFYLLPVIVLFVYTYKTGTFVFNSLNLQILKFTSYQAFLSTLMSFAMGLPGAYLIGRTRFKFKGIFAALSTVPFVMPSISMTLGFISFFGHNGIFNSYFLWPIFHVRFEPLFTLLGVVMGNAFYNFPLTMMIVGSAISNLDPVYSEAAKIDGASKFKSFLFIEFPILLPSVLSALILTFIYCFTSFAVVLVIGGAQFSTIEVQIYMYLTTLIDFKGAMDLTILQVALIGSIVLIFGILRKNAGIFSQEISRSNSKFPLWGILYLTVISIFVFGPIISQVFAGFWNFRNSTFTLEWVYHLFSGRMNPYIGNSVIAAILWTVIFSLSSAILTVILSITSAYAVNKIKNAFFDIIFTSSLAISPVILAFGYLVLQNWIPLNFPSEIIPIYTILSFPIGFQIFLSGWQRFPEEIDEAASVDGANWFQKLTLIRIPILKPQIISTFFFAFAISMGEMSATMVLYNPEFPTISISAYRLFSSMHVPEAQALGSILTIATFIVFYILEKPLFRENQ